MRSTWIRVVILSVYGTGNEILLYSGLKCRLRADNPEEEML